MTSATSLNNRRVLNFFTFTLKKQTPLTVLVTAFCLLFCPGTLLSQIMERIADYGINNDKAPNMNNYFIGYSLGIFLVGIGLTVLLTVTNFGFLYSKKSADVFQALPLKRSELLTVRLLSSFIGGLFTMTLSYATLALINVMPGVVSVSAGRVFTVYVTMVLMLGLLAIFTALFAVCSGGIFDFIIAIGGVNIAIPLLYLIFENVISNNAYGVVHNAEAGLKYTSPFVFAVWIVLEFAEMGAKEIFSSFFSVFSSVNIIDAIIYLIFTPLCALALYKLFGVRRSETAGEAYSFSFVPHIISLLVSVVGGYAVGYIFTGNGFTHFDFWVFFIIGTILCSISAGAVFSRGFKTVRASVIRGAAALGLTVVLSITLIFVAAAEEDYIPSENSIKRITVGYNEEVVFTDNFDIVLDIHKEVLNGGAYNEDYEYTDKEFYCIADEFDSIRMRYYLKSGRGVERQYYSLVNPAFDPLFIRYAKTDEYISRYLDFVGIDKLVELRLTDFGETVTHEEITLMADVFPDVYKKLATTYAEEFKNAPDEAFYESCDILSIYGMNSTTYSIEMRIPESFTKTREVLSGITFDSDTEDEMKY